MANFLSMKYFLHFPWDHFGFVSSEALLFVMNYLICATLHVSSIRLAAHLNSILFFSLLNWERLNVGVLVLTSSMASKMYIIVNELSLMVEWRALWYDHNTSLSYSPHSPLASSSFFFICLISICLLTWIPRSYVDKLSLYPKWWKKFTIAELENWTPNLHIIHYQYKRWTISIVILEMACTSIHFVK